MKICRIYLVSENMNTKILFEFNIQSITDIITNSSSELFVFKNRELEDLVLILSLIHPCWNLEYNEPIQVNRMRDDELATYLEWIYGGSDFDYEIRNIPITKENTKRTGVAKHFGLKPKFVYEDYENWDPNINKLSLKYLPEGLRTIRAMIPDATFAMYSKNDNPTWEYQEKFERLGKRYHLS